eukprot:CAMPEP_0194513244 /NCGR_PEP_ID=MMETSP0253-20130528/45465_1 /TAXON_ID=2966 /ORGANISM="Noctiluca scintillans" /LENGTH=63 /DNA_ID=CAMNT_0039356785 /DNA_START=655 /DNA_END=846 /DNA_ORIENTATION=+
MAEGALGLPSDLTEVAVGGVSWAQPQNSLDLHDFRQTSGCGHARRAVDHAKHHDHAEQIQDNR